MLVQSKSFCPHLLKMYAWNSTMLLWVSFALYTSLMPSPLGENAFGISSMLVLMLTLIVEMSSASVVSL